MSTKLLITDTTLRDAHQSLIATRLKTEDMLPLARVIDKVGFFSVEAWGGATFDSSIRFLA
ncbi:MAG: pyruvate carboxylase subunit B, partial [Methanoregulaceae archaeon]|nr:pyruvate carboxylase subunit B [Methanoregulaceae archaeon]